MNPFKILGGGLKDVVEAIFGGIDKLSTTDEEKLKARQVAMDAVHAFELQMTDLDNQFAAHQAQVLQAEINSASWMARNWRPILMLSFTYIIVHNYVIVPLFSLPTLEIPTDMWELLKIGMGGYVIGRSVEKVVPAVVQARREAS